MDNARPRERQTPEVLTGVGGRRRWSLDDQARVVAGERRASR
jgi:hypothetical protein